MRIKRGPIVFNNVISAKDKCSVNEWYDTALQLRNAVLRNGLYGTGPIMYQVNNYDKIKNEAEYTFYLPVNKPIKMDENHTYDFCELWRFDDGLVLRHDDLDDDIEESYAHLREVAKFNNLTLEEPFYNIYLDVYGDGIIDIYAPIIRGE